ncbi:VPLPA-CTERM sorting domain-containing protein [uncultured Jannaschia sp.]|uniref:VPLPA-CTERM sorting domain-containing protein n=1 Tax=uncultured Jannaschia sp. TaxID=293347 RepID=UPI0026317433|nr:VPLPA-CTERM sorting domain-containing protein [uncultured Jannaschia sp.]
MNTKYLGLTAAAALVASTAGAFAATVTIDSFDTDQVVSDVPSASSVNNSTIAAPEAIGGFRTMAASNSTSNRPTDATTFDSFGGILTFSNTRNSTGSGSLTYDADGAGLMTSLLIGTDPFFSFEGASFDNDSNVNITANLTDNDGTVISYVENVASGNFSPDLFLTQFNTDEDYDDFDFGNVFALQFIVDTIGLQDNIDGQISAITLNAGDTPPNVIPLPATGLLLLGGLGGLTVLRRKKA